VVEDLKVPIVEYEIEGSVEEFSQRLCALDIQTKMPLGAPFIKFMFVQGENGRSSLILRISHAQYDEICLPALLHQFSALYEGRPLAASVPFSTFLYHVVRENIPKSVDYWRNLLQGSSMSIIKPDIPVKHTDHFAISKTFDISSRSREVTIATLPTAAWALCLARRLGLRDVTFGEVVSGRNNELPDCDKVMGPCWQYIPVRVKFDNSWNALDLLNHVQHQHIASTQYEGIGLKEVVEQCTDWPKDIDWFDSVVHQDVEHVESLPFLSANSKMETIYPHAEPLREWKVQAFPSGDTLTIEVITFESWSSVAEELLGEIGDCLMQLVQQPRSDLFS